MAIPVQSRLFENITLLPGELIDLLACLLNGSPERGQSHTARTDGLCAAKVAGALYQWTLVLVYLKCVWCRWFTVVLMQYLHTYAAALQTLYYCGSATRLALIFSASSPALSVMTEALFVTYIDYLCPISIRLSGPPACLLLFTRFDISLHFIACPSLYTGIPELGPLHFSVFFL
eukprot:scpid90082/ scgid24532/ 